MRTKLILSAALSLSLCAASTAQTLPAYLPTDGLVGWWPFNGNANDESGNGNDGTASNVTLVADRFGETNSAYSFIGSTGSVITTNVPNLPYGNDSRSVSVWLKSTSLSGGSSGQNLNILVNWGPSIPCQMFELCVDVGIAFCQTNACVGGASSNTNVSDNVWHNIVATYDSSINTCKIYIDGVFKGSELASLNTTLSSLFFGERNGEIGTQKLDGILDDIAIYNRALTPEEITALYTGEPVNLPTACNPLPSNLQNGLVGYWPFCGNANDESGNGNNGTVNGATLTEDRFGIANSSYDFNGTSNFISVPTSSSLENISNITMSAWIFIDDWFTIPIGDKYFPILHKTNSTTHGKYFFWVTENSMQAQLDNKFALIQPYLPNLGSWHHVAVTIENTNSKFYYDGINVSTQSTGNFAWPLANNLPLIIGNTIPGSPTYANGKIDDIAIYNRALSPEEVQQLYTLNACTFTIYDTVTVENVVTVYDTVLTTVTDTLIINTLITELAPPANTNTIKVFPNPAGSILTIDYGNYALMNGYQLRIENSLGQEVFQTNISQQSDTLSLGSWGGNGLYFVHIVDPQGNTVDIRKIVLQ